MSAPRLPFLWPMLYKPWQPARSTPRIRACRPEHRKSFASTVHRYDASDIKRYGTAQEPAPHLRDVKKPAVGEDQQGPASSRDTAPEPETDQPQEQLQEPSPPSLKVNTDATDAAPREPPPEPVRTPEPKPLDTILHMPSPAEEEKRKPPHLKTPPYVHHFDTYGLVKDLAKSGFSGEQAVSVMKAVRSILADNMELARDGLVSKSHVENETYLFKAACSELRTEIGNKRKSEMEKMRTERNQLQHEVDLLGQRTGQETGNLKDELKGLFDDRKMAIQELNYKITVALNSDARSEVEGLRWVLTRRAAITVGVSALMLFAALRYMSYIAHLEEQQEKKRKENEKKQSPDAERHGAGGLANLGPSNEDALGAELLATEGGVSSG